MTPTVIEAACTMLLPILAQWALSLHRLLSHLLPRVLTKLKSQLKPVNQSPGKEHVDVDKIVASIGVLQNLLPHTVVCVADNDVVRSEVTDDVSSELSNYIFL